MPTKLKQHKVTSHPMLDDLIDKYQKENSIANWSTAATELIALGIESWLLYNDDSFETGDQQTVNLYHAWRKNKMVELGIEGRSDLSDEHADALSFNKYILGIITPKVGGPRPGSGRKKGSRNKYLGDGEVVGVIFGKKLKKSVAASGGKGMKPLVDHLAKTNTGRFYDEDDTNKQDNSD